MWMCMAHTSFTGRNRTVICHRKVTGALILCVHVLLVDQELMEGSSFAPITSPSLRMGLLSLFESEWSCRCCMTWAASGSRGNSGLYIQKGPLCSVASPIFGVSSQIFIVVHCVHIDSMDWNRDHERFDPLQVHHQLPCLCSIEVVHIMSHHIHWWQFCTLTPPTADASQT